MHSDIGIVCGGSMALWCKAVAFNLRAMALRVRGGGGGGVGGGG